ncbi:hypothetical protein C8R48DRAFT_772657 [Suillus tomentosus]|nr:hypothetical protein C8R48DRAFT_780080 [Suillus tomentosus]KAG1865659.1 hypothetical protein C8R48DRAFT_772657 [Suillus tomentosus]
MSIPCKKAQSKLDVRSTSLQRSDKLQPSIENLPDVQGYATNDLFVRHPIQKHLWKIVGRADDVIVLSSGEKTVPSQTVSVLISLIDLALTQSFCMISYNVVELSHEVGDNTLPSQWTESNLSSWLLSWATNVRTDLKPTVDLFAQGFDSLSATYLGNRLISALKKSSKPGIQRISSLITQSVIFENPLSNH